MAAPLDFLGEESIIQLVTPKIRQERLIVMKITLDLDTNEIVVPKNFFKNIDKQNETIVKMGGQKISGIELIKKSFETAMADTDKYLHTKA